MAQIKNIITLHSKKDSLKVHKKEEFTFLIFDESNLDIKKSVDKPDDYYFKGDEITFSVNVTNIGNANLRNFTLKDNSIKDLNPLSSGYYDITSEKGEINIFDDYILINEITLLKGESFSFQIHGMIKEDEDSLTDDFPSLEEDSSF